MSVRKYAFGKVREVPEAGGQGRYSDRVRWRVLRDTVGDMLAICPRSERGLATRLGDMWAFFDWMADESVAGEQEWPTLF